MTMLFTCPHCGKQVAVAGELAGRTGLWTGCGKTSIIRSPDEILMRRVARVVAVALAAILGLVVVLARDSFGPASFLSPIR